MTDESRQSSAALVGHLADFPDDAPLQGILRAMRDWSPAARNNFAGALRACWPEMCRDAGWPDIRAEVDRLRAALAAAAEENGRLAQRGEALRQECIIAGQGGTSHCCVCSANWDPDDPESHDGECPASPASDARSPSEREFGHVLGAAQYNGHTMCSRCGLTAADTNWLSPCKPLEASDARRGTT